MILTKEIIQEKIKYYDDSNFSFNEEAHAYTLDGKIVYGVTSFLNRFVKPFDSDYWSKKKADAAGIPQAELLKQWDDKRDRSCELGHNVHAWIENFYEKNDETLTKDAEANERVVKFQKIYESKLKQLESVASELRVFSRKYSIAGTIDKVYLWEGNIIVGDWKTNKKIKTDKDFCFGKLLYPFERHKENELNKYSLQLSLYQLLLEEAGIYSDYAFICHIPGDGEAKIYKTKDFRAELRTYLNHDWMNHDPIIPIHEAKEPIKISKIW